MTQKFIIAILWVIIIAHNGMAGGVWDRINRDKTIRIAILKDKPLFSFKNGAQYEGYDAEYARNLVNFINVNATLIPVDESEILKGNWGPKFDIAIASTLSSKDIEQKFEIIDYYYLRHMMIVSQGLNPKNKLSDLARGAMGALKGSYSEKYMFKKLDSAEVPKMPRFAYRITPSGNRTFDTIEEGIREIAKPNNRDLETIILPSFEARQALYKNIPVRIFPEPMYYEPVVAIAEKGDVELTKKIKEAIGRMRESGTAKRISQKYLNEDISQPVP